MAATLKLVRRAVSVPTFVADAEQEEVIAHRGSLGVFGGAGTGKTRTLIRAALSRMDAGQDPNSVLIITYGRESASIIRDEIAIGAKSTATNPLARTFHSLAFSILNEKLTPDDPMYILVSGAEQDAFISEMLESGFDKYFDKIIVVTAPIETRIDRILKRDQLNEIDIRNRMNKQMPDEIKSMKADYLINNSGVELLIPQIIEINTFILQ